MAVLIVPIVVFGTTLLLGEDLLLLTYHTPATFATAAVLTIYLPPALHPLCLPLPPPPLLSPAGFHSLLPPTAFEMPPASSCGQRWGWGKDLGMGEGRGRQKSVGLPKEQRWGRDRWEGRAEVHTTAVNEAGLPSIQILISRGCCNNYNFENCP